MKKKKVMIFGMISERNRQQWLHVMASHAMLWYGSVTSTASSSNLLTLMQRVQLLILLSIFPLILMAEFLVYKFLLNYTIFR